MKKLWIAMAGFLMLTVPVWAAAATGMPALDEIQADAAKNGALSKRLGFSEDQRKNILKMIEDVSPGLIELRDALVAAENKLETAKKSKKKPDIAAARADKDAAAVKLNAARDEAFKKLKTLMSDAQYDALKKWRAEGKANVR